jgi:pimeloyl-ACP methyl ester carboxylesterase
MYAPVNDIQIYYEDHGGGGDVPLLLLHGGGSTIHTTFARIMPMLARTRRVIAFDQQGHGRTADAGLPFTFERSADDAVELLRYLKIERADFLGFSNGGTIAMQIAIRHPEAVRKLIIASANATRDGLFEGFFEMMQTAKLDDMPASLQQAYLESAPRPDLQRFFEKGRRRMIQFKDIPETDLRSIEAPALIVAGDRDVTRPEHAVELSRLLPNARLAILPGGHGTYLGAVDAPASGTPPEITAAIFEDFLNAD